MALRPRYRAAVAKKFETFIVVREKGGSTEIHTVGASGGALEDLIGEIEEVIEDYLADVVGDCERDDDEDQLTYRVGMNPEIPTGVVVHYFDDVQGIGNALRDHFDAADVVIEADFRPRTAPEPKGDLVASVASFEADVSVEPKETP